EEDTELNKWLLTIKEILDDPQPDAMDFLDAIKLNLFASEIFVFTPKGEIKTMPANCTALDFAFSIHTFLGSHCIGAKVNHKLVPLSHVLQSGDQVEILTSNSQHVKESWISFVSTAKARNKIQGILRREAREQQKRGEKMLADFLAQHGLEISTITIEKLCSLHNKEKHEQLLQDIGSGAIVLGNDDLKAINNDNLSLTGRALKKWKSYVPFLGKKNKSASTKQDYFVVGKDFNKKKPVYVTDQNITQFVFPKCCHAIPGDDALGFIDRNNHIVIHARNCSIANKLKASYGNRILDIKWDMHYHHTFTASIYICGIDRVGMLHDVSEIVSGKMNINITKLLITVNGEGFFEGTIDLRVHDRSDLVALIKELKDIPGLQEVRQS
ncbi:MAG: bifunctional (p)ppGpp synthetase/guanosine-3',5'-bis(diphosphate) 3'-pyrophosphohydrolase, partial [Prevotella sp.]|nr:bifunctional (p)ppGpp synthetase/guanosine-3',5'-bis(diphosphate) 3'-pyrophosphohydrolase [Prevotella sp.]